MATVPSQTAILTTRGSFSKLIHIHNSTTGVGKQCIQTGGTSIETCVNSITSACARLASFQTPWNQFIIQFALLHNPRHILFSGRGLNILYSRTCIFNKSTASTWLIHTLQKGIQFSSDGLEEIQNLPLVTLHPQLHKPSLKFSMGTVSHSVHRTKSFSQQPFNILFSPFLFDVQP